jgi:hypothetical protein
MRCAWNRPESDGAQIGLASSAVPTTTAVATMSTTTSSATVSPTAFSRCALAGDINYDRSAFNIFTVEHLNSGLCFLRRGHLYETKASLTASSWVEHNPG